MTFLTPIETEYGTAYLIGYMVGGGLLVSLPKKHMTKKHPQYMGGPCVNFILEHGDK